MPCQVGLGASRSRRGVDDMERWDGILSSVAHKRVLGKWESGIRIPRNFTKVQVRVSTVRFRLALSGFFPLSLLLYCYHPHHLPIITVSSAPVSMRYFERRVLSCPPVFLFWLSDEASPYDKFPHQLLLSFEHLNMPIQPQPPHRGDCEGSSC